MQSQVNPARDSSRVMKMYFYQPTHAPPRPSHATIRLQQDLVEIALCNIQDTRWDCVSVRGNRAVRICTTSLNSYPCMHSFRIDDPDVRLYVRGISSSHALPTFGQEVEVNWLWQNWISPYVYMNNTRITRVRLFIFPNNALLFIDGNFHNILCRCQLLIYQLAQ